MLSPPGAESLAHFQANPVGFVYDVIGATPQRWQATALWALADPARTRIAIKSCHGPGKTALDAWALIWWLSCFYPAKVPVTAPTEDQLKYQLWPECHKWIKGSKILDSILMWRSEKICLRQCPERQFAVARVAQVRQTAMGPQAFGLQGFHDDYLLFISDESSGVPNAADAAIEGAMSTTRGTVKRLATGNPNIPEGWFFDAFGKNRHLWTCMTVGFSDSRQVSRRWAMDMIRTYGIDSPFVRTRVLGQFPLGVKGGLVSLAPVEAATTRDRREWVTREYQYPVRALGVDVAHTGSNDSVIAYAVGRNCERLVRHHGKLTTQLAKIIKGEAIDYNAKIVVVDADGGYGAAVADKLQDPSEDTRMPQSITVIRWHGNGAPINKRDYLNKRTEIHYEIKLALEGGKSPIGCNGTIALPADEHLIAQLTAIKVGPRKDGTGTMQLESKMDFVKRLGRSPDELDAVSLSLAPGILGLSGLPPAMSSKVREALGLPKPGHRRELAYGL